jgi:hypothetical protein
MDIFYRVTTKFYSAPCPAAECIGNSCSNQGEVLYNDTRHQADHTIEQISMFKAKLGMCT